MWRIARSVLESAYSSCSPGRVSRPSPRRQNPRAMSARTETLIIEKSLPQERLDTFLRSQFPVVSGGAIQRLIEEGHITVNGHKVKPTHAPRAGETISVHWP